MVKISEVKINIATAIAAAFGFVIALLWRDIIIGLLKYANLWTEGGKFDSHIGAIISIVVAIIITVVCVFGIMYISKWGGIDKK